MVIRNVEIGSWLYELKDLQLFYGTVHTPKPTENNRLQDLVDKRALA